MEVSLEQQIEEGEGKHRIARAPTSPGDVTQIKNEHGIDAGEWKMERRWNVKEPNTWSKERPLGTWCGYKRPAEAQGDNKGRRLWSTGNAGEEERQPQWTERWRASDSDMERDATEFK